jgi:hypothetical protein
VTVDSQVSQSLKYQNINTFIRQVLAETLSVLAHLFFLDEFQCVLISEAIATV